MGGPAADWHLRSKYCLLFHTFRDNHWQKKTRIDLYSRRKIPTIRAPGSEDVSTLETSFQLESTVLHPVYNKFSLPEK
ncbi:hypothetical protein BS17DRAFT_791986 [Gyrodon lividus]|nr:hypothetical protein BS17DRAFT_792026 [Gyrodon lividus]KAF9218152.1 hypothetical protein BS17DRAFT_791986 [Gyrodon lividus]